MGALIKNVVDTYIPADPGDPGAPGAIAEPGYWYSEPHVSCSFVRRTADNATPTFTRVYWAYECTTSYTPVYRPATASSSGTPYRAPTPAQIIVSLNVGWNSHARTVGKLDAGKYLEYSIKMGTTGALLAVGHAGQEGSPIELFTHGLMTDVSSINVFEGGVVVATLATNQPTTKIRIARLTDGRIVYGVDTGVFHISSAPGYLPAEDLYVYAMLYSGYDEVSSAAFVTGDLLAGTGATVSGIGSLSARAEQFVEASMAAAGLLIASPFPTAALSGAGMLRTWVERFAEANISGASSLWSYAEASRPTTAYLSGAGSLIASPFPSVALVGIGSLTASTGTAVAMTGFGRLVTEAYRGQIAEASLSGASRLIAFADVGGRGYGDLPAFVGLGGDTDYGQARGDLLYFVSGAVNGQSGFVPPAITRGYANLPLFAGVARGVDIGIGTASATLPPFTGVAGDYSYGFSSGSLPMFVGEAYGGFIPDDMMVLISPVFGATPLDPQIDLVMILNSAGELTSTLSLTRAQALDLLSALQQSSSFSMLGVYSMSTLSDLRGMSLEAFNIGSSADLYDTGAVWVVNLDSNASVQYERYGFNSFFQRDNDYYGVANDGIYKLTGATDNGDPIDALVEFAKSDFGVPQDKTMPNVYLAAASDGALVLKVVTGTNTLFYTARSSSVELDKHRVDLGRGLQGMFWQFSVLNQNGADFNVAGMEFLPIASKRRI